MEKIKVSFKNNTIDTTCEYNIKIIDNKVVYHENDYLVTININDYIINRRNKEYDINIDLNKEIITVSLIGHSNSFEKKIKVINKSFNNEIFFKYYVIDDDEYIEYHGKLM